VRENALGRPGCLLRVTLETAGKDRTRKKTALRQLEELIVDSIKKGTPVVWENFDCSFRFLAQRYFWHDKEIYVTANEALFLYRWLVLNEDICELQTYYLRNMRRRMGKEFLSEVTDK
jgi:hypothetical protein